MVGHGVVGSARDGRGLERFPRVRQGVCVLVVQAVVDSFCDVSKNEHVQLMRVVWLQGGGHVRAPTCYHSRTNSYISHYHLFFYGSFSLASFFLVASPS